MLACANTTITEQLEAILSHCLLEKHIDLIVSNDTATAFYPTFVFVAGRLQCVPVPKHCLCIPPHKNYRSSMVLSNHKIRGINGNYCWNESTHCT